MTGQIIYPTDQVEQSYLDNNALQRGFIVGVELPQFKGNFASQYSEYSQYIPMVKLIEESQCFINKVCDRHCIEKPIWTKQSGANDRYEYEPVSNSGYKLAGYSLNDYGFWDNFKRNIKYLGSGLNCDRFIAFDPWKNITGKTQWSGYNYRVTKPHTIINNSGRPHPSSLFYYGKPNKEDYNQYVPVLKQVYPTVFKCGKITETKTVSKQHQLPRCHTGNQTVRGVYLNALQSGDCLFALPAQPQYPLYGPQCFEFGFAYPYYFGGGGSLSGIGDFGIPCVNGLPSGVTSRYDPDPSLSVGHVSNYIYSGNIDYNDMVNYVFTDSSLPPQDSLIAETITFTPSPIVEREISQIGNEFIFDVDWTMTYPDGPLVNTVCGKLNSTTATSINQSGSVYASISLIRECEIDYWPLVYSGIQASSVQTHNMRERTGMIYDSGKCFYIGTDLPKYSVLYCGPQVDENIFCNNNIISYSRKERYYHPSGYTTPCECVENTYAPCNEDYDCGGEGVFRNITPGYWYCNGVYSKHNPFICGDQSFTVDGTPKSNRIAIPSGKYILAFSLESSLSGMLETWRDRSYNKLCEIEIDSSIYNIIPTSIPYNCPYPAVPCPSSFQGTNDKNDFNNQKGFGFDRTTPLGIKTSGISQPIFNNALNLAEIFSCGFESGHNMLFFYTFKELYSPTPDSIWISDIAYTDFSEFSLGYTGTAYDCSTETGARSGVLSFNIKGLGFPYNHDYFYNHDAGFYPSINSIIRNNGFETNDEHRYYVPSGKSVLFGGMNTVIEPPYWLYPSSHPIFDIENYYGF